MRLLTGVITGSAIAAQSLVESILADKIGERPALG